MNLGMLRVVLFYLSIKTTNMDSQTLYFFILGKIFRGKQSVIANKCSCTSLFYQCFVCKLVCASTVQHVQVRSESPLCRPILVLNSLTSDLHKYWEWPMIVYTVWFRTTVIHISAGRLNHRLARCWYWVNTRILMVIN